MRLWLWLRIRLGGRAKEIKTKRDAENKKEVIEKERLKYLRCVNTIRNQLKIQKVKQSVHNINNLHIFIRFKGIVLLRTVTLMSMYYSKRIVSNYRKWRSTITCRVSKRTPYRHTWMHAYTPLGVPSSLDPPHPLWHTDKMSIKYLKPTFTFG